MSRRKNPLDARHLEPHRDKAELSKVTSDQPYGRRHVRDFSGQGVDYVGCVVNPKNMRPYFVLKRKNSHGFYLYVPSTKNDDVEVVGICYLEESDNEYSAPAEQLGFPRIHTPWGVVERGSGLGTALYTAGSLGGAYVSVGVEDGFVKDDIPGSGGRGCSSGTGANDNAQAWWEHAARKGLVEEHEGEGASGTETTEESEYIRFSTYVAISLSGILEAGDAEEYVRDTAEEQLTDAASAAEGDYSFDSIDEEYVDDYNVDMRDMRMYFEATLLVWANEEASEVDENAAQVHVRVELTVDNLDPDQWKDIINDYFVDNTEEIPGFETAEGIVVGVHSVDKVRMEDGSDEVELEVSGTVYRSGYIESETDESTAMFAYPLKKAIGHKLVLDMAPALLAEFDLDQPRFLDVVLNLDLGEVEDPEAIAFFFALASYLGASHSELRRFMNSVLAFRSDLQASLADAAVERKGLLREREDDDGTARERAEWFKVLEQGGLRVNPSEQPDYEKVARKLFGDIADLD